MGSKPAKALTKPLLLKVGQIPGKLEKKTTAKDLIFLIKFVTKYSLKMSLVEFHVSFVLFFAKMSHIIANGWRSFGASASSPHCYI